MIEESRFDVFSGSLDKDFLWIESVCGLDQARERMEKLAFRNPGRYFLFSARSELMVAWIDTSLHMMKPVPLSKAKGVAQTAESSSGRNGRGCC
jgi:hypothetical protein